MEEIQYVGERLLPGIIGRFALLTAFAAAIVSSVAYIYSIFQKDELNRSWERMGRYGYIVHGVSTLTMIACLFYILVNHMYEFKYAWEHASEDLPMKYIFSAFWEGQEGSFLLWMFWHVVLGFIGIATLRQWEAPVLGFVAMTQAFLGSMLLGLYFGEETVIGSNPFLLLRDHFDAPIFAQANYLDFIQDGTGLNPLLQNYWMTIHPPTLFLGFALTTIPFAFVLGSLLKNDHKTWVQPALVWTLVGVCVLGVGILMGGAWAYEALSFGGFWAWDPVENASLVPWLTFVAGMHTLLIYKHTGRALIFTYVLLIASFLFILYSTFLTRSGILGDTSVHSFTDLGMTGQLVIFMVFFVVLSIAVFAWRYKDLPASAKDDEHITSREFWMFVGSLVFVISAVLITFSTSLPVVNKLFGTDWVITETERMDHYNNRQVWIAVFLGGLIAITQFFKYKKTDAKKFAKALSIAVILSVVISGFLIWSLEIYNIPYALMLFTGVLATIANADFIITRLKGNMQKAGGSLAHVGFGLMLVGVLISQYKQEVFSINKQGVNFGDAFSEKDKALNVLLTQGTAVEMGEYEVTYLGDTVSGFDSYYKVNFVRFDKDYNEIENFTLMPHIRSGSNPGERFPNPDTKHFLHKDIYTHVTSTPKPKEEQEARQDTFATSVVSKGDTFYSARAFLVVKDVNPAPPEKGFTRRDGDIAVGLKIGAYTLQGEEYEAEPVYLIRDNRAVYIPDTIIALNTEIRLEEIRPQTEKFVIGVRSAVKEDKFITLKALLFPYINVLWLGWIITVIGFGISVWQRVKEYKRVRAREAEAI